MWYVERLILILKLKLADEFLYTRSYILRYLLIFNVIECFSLLSVSGAFIKYHGSVISFMILTKTKFVRIVM